MMAKKGKRKVMWGFIYTGIFIIAFVISAVIKITYSPLAKEYKIDWNDTIGTVRTNIAYENKEQNKFDLYLPADKNKETYGLIVYLHAGGFTSGDKSDDAEILKWFCSKGYVTAGINYTLRTDENNASIYSQSKEIKQAMPFVIEEAKKLGYNIDKMTISGGSAGGTLAMLYAYRDAKESPVPVKLMFEMVGPSSFYAEDWGIYGLDQNSEAAASLFGVMAGVDLTSKMIESQEYIELMKPISSSMWIDKSSVPSLLLYGTEDKIQPYKSVRHLEKALKDNEIDYKLFIAPHSGHGVQNDDKIFKEYMDTIMDYLDKYMPVK